MRNVISLLNRDTFSQLDDLGSTLLFVIPVITENRDSFLLVGSTPCVGIATRYRKTNKSYFNIERQGTAGQPGRVADSGADATSGVVPERRRRNPAGGDNGITSGDREPAGAIGSFQKPESGRRQSEANGGQRFATFSRTQSEQRSSRFSSLS